MKMDYFQAVAAEEVKKIKLTAKSDEDFNKLIEEHKFKNSTLRSEQDIYRIMQSYCKVQIVK